VSNTEFNTDKQDLTTKVENLRKFLDSFHNTLNTIDLTQPKEHLDTLDTAILTVQGQVEIVKTTIRTMGDKYAI
jgi:hypothetical protein